MGIAFINHSLGSRLIAPTIFGSRSFSCGSAKHSAACVIEGSLVFHLRLPSLELCLTSVMASCALLYKGTFLAIREIREEQTTWA